MPVAVEWLLVSSEKCQRPEQKHAYCRDGDGTPDPPQRPWEGRCMCFSKREWIRRPGFQPGPGHVQEMEASRVGNFFCFSVLLYKQDESSLSSWGCCEDCISECKESTRPGCYCLTAQGEFHELCIMIMIQGHRDRPLMTLERSCTTQHIPDRLPFYFVPWV